VLWGQGRLAHQHATNVTRLTGGWVEIHESSRPAVQPATGLLAEPPNHAVGGGSPMFAPLMAALRVTRPAGPPRTRPDAVRADKAHSSRAIRDHLRSRGVNAVIFLGGWEKGAVLGILKPHIFFDDQVSHLEGTQSLVPSVHVPFGIKNIVSTGTGPSA